MLLGFCDACNKKRRLINVGMYEFKGKIHYIRLCQWCRAAATRRKKANKNKPFWERKKGL